MQNNPEIRILSLLVLCLLISRKEVQLIVPEYCRITERLQLETTNEIKPNEKLTFEMTPVPASETYMNGVKQGIEKFRMEI